MCSRDDDPSAPDRADLRAALKHDTYGYARCLCPVHHLLLATPDRADLPVGAYVASALMAAHIPNDSGEDVDRFLNELEARGYAVVPLRVALDAEKAADTLTTPDRADR